MALTNLQVRLITAGVLIVLLLGIGTLAAYYPFAHWLVVSICYIAIAFVCFEFSEICSNGFKKLSKGLTYLACLLTPITLQFLLITFYSYEYRSLSNENLLVMILGGALLSLLCFLFVTTLFARNSLSQAKVLIEDFPIGLILVEICGASLIILASLQGSYHYLLWLLLVVCLNDTAAYFAGKRLQGPKLSPVISPNKTISGSVAGVIVGILVGALCQGLLGFRSDHVLWFLITLVIAAQLGDLLKSYVKRVHEVKDSGTLLPGHGGVLDRIDGVLAAAPILLLWLMVAGNFSQ